MGVVGQQLFIGLDALRQAFGIVEPINAQDQPLPGQHAFDALDHLGGGRARRHFGEGIGIGANGEGAGFAAAEIDRPQRIA